MPTSHTAQVPTVNKLEYEVADIAEDGFVSLILADGSLKEDLKLPDNDEEIFNDLTKLWNENKDKNQIFFTIIKAVGQEKIIAGRIK